MSTLPHQCIHAYLFVNDDNQFELTPIMSDTPPPKRVFRKVTIAYDKCNAGITFYNPVDDYSHACGRNKALEKLNKMRNANENSDKYPLGAVAHSRFQPIRTRELKVVVNRFLETRREKLSTCHD